MRIKQETITPEFAAELLGGNSHNRHIRQRHVLDLAGAIMRGEWQLNGDTILVSAESELLDGQHRLLAVIEANEAIESLVAYGVEASVMKTKDTGKVRSVADHLRIRGVASPTNVGGALTYLWRLQNGIGGTLLRPTTTQALALYDKDGKTVSDFVGYRLSRYIKMWRGAPSAWIGVMTHLASFDQEACETFFDHVEDNTGEVNSAMWQLRGWMDVQHKHRPTPLMAVTIKAWNHYVSGEEAPKLSWRPIGKNPEPFPMVLGGE